MSSAAHNLTGCRYTPIIHIEMSIYRCAAETHHRLCDGTVDTTHHPYYEINAHKRGREMLYYRWLCVKDGLTEMVALRPDDRRWLINLITKVYDYESSEHADRILRALG